MGEQYEEGYVSFTRDAGGDGWGGDYVGCSGLAGSEFADGVEPLLDSSGGGLNGRTTVNSISGKVRNVD